MSRRSTTTSMIQSADLILAKSSSKLPKTTRLAKEGWYNGLGFDLTAF